jgi:uncharacterized membrane protein
VHAVGIVFPVPLAASWLSAVLYGALFGFVVYARGRTNDSRSPGEIDQAYRHWPAARKVGEIVGGATGQFG